MPSLRRTSATEIDAATASARSSSEYLGDLGTVEDKSGVRQSSTHSVAVPGTPPAVEMRVDGRGQAIKDGEVHAVAGRYPQAPADEGTVVGQQTRCRGAVNGRRTCRRSESSPEQSLARVEDLDAGQGVARDRLGGQGRTSDGLAPGEVGHHIPLRRGALRLESIGEMGHLAGELTRQHPHLVG
jgi:hypothetical protein